MNAGPEKCPMYDETPELIAERVDKLLAKVKAEPIPFLTILGSRDSYGLIDYSRVKGMIFGSLYNTHGGQGKFIMTILALLERGAMMSFNDGLDSLFTCHCSEPNTHFDGIIAHSLAIACGDAPPIDETLEEARSLYDKMAQNTSFAEVWPIHLHCS